MTAGSACLRKHLIVARHEENLDWTATIHGWEILVVQKGVDLPNTGREATSYLWGIHRLYPQLEPGSLVCCLQGRPLDHTPNLDILGHQVPDGFHPVGGMETCDGRGSPHHPNLPVQDMYERWIGLPFPGRVRFVAGAQFIVTGSRVLQHPRSKYLELLEDVNNLDQGAWVMERLWEPLFGGNS